MMEADEKTELDKLREKIEYIQDLSDLDKKISGENELIKNLLSEVSDSET